MHNMTELLAALANSPAVPVPNLSPAYSNEAFALLGLTFYRAMGKTYRELVRSEIVEPLNTTNAGTSQGNTLRGIIPTDNSFWGADLPGMRLKAGSIPTPTTSL